MRWSHMHAIAEDVVARGRPRGAPIGNRNALRHGRYSAAAREARTARRHAILSGIASRKEIFSTDKRNNSRSRFPAADARRCEEIFGTDKRNNSGAGDAQRSLPRKRGAPKGNRNALKHGLRSSEMQAFRAERRTFIRQVRFDIAWAKTVLAAKRAGL